MLAPTEIKVFIADEQKEILEQLSEFINAAPDMKVAGTASDGGALFNYFQHGNNGVQVALVDIGMPVMDGLTAVGKIKEICKDTLKIIVITGLSGRDYPTEAVSRQADGFIAKCNGKETILDGIRKVLQGSFVYLRDPNDVAHPTEPPQPLPNLIPIELRVLQGLAKGQISKEMADEFNLGISNVERIRRIIMSKLHAENPVMLGIIAEKYGLIQRSVQETTTL